MPARLSRAAYADMFGPVGIGLIAAMGNAGGRRFDKGNTAPYILIEM
jgi:hypothetical protein